MNLGCRHMKTIRWETGFSGRSVAVLLARQSILAFRKELGLPLQSRLKAANVAKVTLITGSAEEVLLSRLKPRSHWLTASLQAIRREALDEKVLIDTIV